MYVKAVKIRLLKILTVRRHRLLLGRPRPLRPYRKVHSRRSERAKTRFADGSGGVGVAGGVRHSDKSKYHYDLNSDRNANVSE